MCTTPERRPCGSGPPRRSMSTSSPVTERTTSGPVTKIRPSGPRITTSVERRAVGRAAGRRAEHDGDLRDLAGGLRHRVEDLADRVQREHALGQPGAAGVPEPDDRRLVGERALVGVHDDLAADLAHRAAHHGRVGAERDHVRAVHLADGGEHAAAVVGGDQLAACPRRTVPRAGSSGCGGRSRGELGGLAGGRGAAPWGVVRGGRRRRRRWRRRSRRSCSARRCRPRAGRAAWWRCPAPPRGPGRRG